MRGVRTAVLPAAGLGTRLLPATRAVPNELFPVGGRPAIEWALSEAAEAGIERVVIVSSPRKSAIEAYLEREVRAADGPVGPATEPAGPRPFPRVTVVHQLTPAGLGDAVRVGRAAVGTEPFAVLLPDEILLGGGRLLREMLDGYERTGRSQVSLLSVEPDEISSYGCAELAPGLRQERHVPVAGCVEKPMPAAAPSNYRAVRSLRARSSRPRRARRPRAGGARGGPAHRCARPDGAPRRARQGRGTARRTDASTSATGRAGSRRTSGCSASSPSSRPRPRGREGRWTLHHARRRTVRRPARFSRDRPVPRGAAAGFRRVPAPAGAHRSATGPAPACGCAQEASQSTSALVTCEGRSSVDRCPQSGTTTSRAPSMPSASSSASSGGVDRVAIADEDERRAADRPQVGPGVDTSHDRPLLADEGRRARLVGHEVDQAPQRFVVLSVGVDEQGKLLIGDLVETTGARQADLARATLALRDRVGSRGGVQQREPHDPLGRLAHDLERHVAAHREASEGEARRGVGQDAPRDRVHGVVARVVGDGDRAEPPQLRELGPVEPCGGQEPGDEDDRHRAARARHTPSGSERGRVHRLRASAPLPPTKLTARIPASSHRLVGPAYEGPRPPWRACFHQLTGVPVAPRFAGSSTWWRAEGGVPFRAWPT